MQVWVVVRLGEWAAESPDQLLHVAASKELARNWALSQFYQLGISKDALVEKENMLLVRSSWDDPEDPETRIWSVSWSIECHEVEE